MTRTPVATPQAPAAIGPYSQGIAAGGFLFCSGQLGLDPGTGDFAGPDVEAQAERAMTNLRSVLDAAGCTFDDVVKTTIFLADMADFAAMNEVWDDWVAPGDAPPRATVQARLAKPEWKIEIVVTAALWTE